MRLADYQSFLPKDEIDPPQAQPVLDQVLPGLFERALAGRGRRQDPARGRLRPRAAHPRREQDRRHQPAQGRPEQPLASGPRAVRPGVHAAPRGRVGGPAVQEPAPQAQRDLPRGHPDPEDVRRGRASSTCRRSRRTAIPSTTGAVKNAFGGLLKEVRHYAHKYIHEVLVDLLYMQKELHPGLFVVDGRHGLRQRRRAPDHASRRREHHPRERRFGGHRRRRGEDHGLRAARHPLHPHGPREGTGRRRPPRDRYRGRRRLGPELRVQDAPQFRHLGRPDDPQRVPPAAREAPPALAPGRLGAVRLERLSRPDVVSDHRQAPHPRIHEDGLGPRSSKNTY